MPKEKRTIKLVNRLGLHVRAATQLVKTAGQFDCEVFIDREGFEQVNGKSIMSVLTLAAPKGAELTLTTTGNQAQEAMEAITQLIHNRFGEED